MSFLLFSALAVSGPALSACSWDRPGINPFMGDVVAAVDRYPDIPVATRAKLKQRMALRRYDELVTIKRDAIEGAYRYTDLRDMHFGMGTICQTVTRERWVDAMQERGLVYCEDGHCLIVPTVCRNVSRVTRLPHKQAGSEVPPASPSRRAELPSLPFAAVTEPPELEFEAPGAGAKPSFASLVEDTSRVPIATSQPSSANVPSHSPRDFSWLGFAGLSLPSVQTIFSSDPGFPRTALQSQPVLTSGLPPVPGVVPPPSTPPVPTTTPVTPPVVVTLPTVPSLPAPTTPDPEPLPVVAVPNVPGVPGVPSTPSEPVPTGVPPAPVVPSTSPSPGSFSGDPGSSIATAPIPEPGTLVLMALGLGLVTWVTRRSSAG